MKKNTIYLTVVLLFALHNSILANNNAFRFKISGNNYTDETIIRLLNGATENFDAAYDAWKLFSPNTSVPSIYTQISAGQELSINALPEYTTDQSITIFTNIPVSGTYTLSIEEVFPMTSNYKISLTEISSNTHYTIFGDTAITFSINQQQGVATFTFNISTPLSVNTTNETCFNSGDGAIEIVKNGNNNWAYEILDTTNTILYSGTAITDTILINNIAAQTYLVRSIHKGIIDESTVVINTPAQIIADFMLDNDTIYISEGAIINTNNQSQNATTYLWDFGDGFLSSNFDESHQYLDTGIYEIKLIASSNQCMDSVSKNLTVLNHSATSTSLLEINTPEILVLSKGNGLFEISNASAFESLQIVSLSGTFIYEKSINNNNHTINFNGYARGVYILILKTRHQQYYKKKLVY